MPDQRAEPATTVAVRPELARTIAHLTARWANAETALLKHVFPLLAEGHAVTLDRLAEAAGSTKAVASTAIRSGRVTLDDEGRIIELFGVTLNTTPHHIHAEGVSLYSCCALVAHVLPRLLNRTVRVRSHDPITGQHVELDIAPNGIRRFQPEAAVTSMIVTDERMIREDTPVLFCRHVHHFVSRKSASEFVVGNPGRYVLAIRDMDVAAHKVYSAIWRGRPAHPIQDRTGCTSQPPEPR